MRTNSAVWAAPLVFFLAMRFVGQQSAAEQGGLPLPVTAVGLWALAFVGPTCAASAAWEAGRLRRGGVLATPNVRSPATVMVQALVPTVALGILALAAALVLRIYMSGGWVQPDWRMSAVAVVVLISHVSFGFALGTRVSAVAAVPAALLLPFLWMIGTPAVDPPWVRHLSGTWSECCRLHEELDPSTLQAPLLLAVGVIAGSVVALSWPLRQRRVLSVVLSLLPVAIVVPLAASLVNDLGYKPVQSRSKSDLQCSGASPVVICLWPENSSQSSAVHAVADSLAAYWGPIGVPIPAGFTEQRREPLPEGFRSFRIPARSAKGNIVASFSVAVVGEPPACPDRETGRAPHLGGRAYAVLVAFLSLSAGSPTEAVESQFSPRDFQEATRACALPAAKQAQWFAQNAAAWHACDVEPAPANGFG
ncbi:MAG: hypothetical protein ABIQ47_05375 [Tepidiformaceae bacterium]